MTSVPTSLHDPAKLVPKNNWRAGPLGHRMPVDDVQVAAADRSPRHLQHDFIRPRPRRRNLPNLERARLRCSLEQRFHVKGGRWETRTLDLTDVNRAL